MKTDPLSTFEISDLRGATSSLVLYVTNEFKPLTIQYTKIEPGTLEYSKKLHEASTQATCANDRHMHTQYQLALIKGSMST